MQQQLLQYREAGMCRALPRLHDGCSCKTAQHLRVHTLYCFAHLREGSTRRKSRGCRPWARIKSRLRTYTRRVLPAWSMRSVCQAGYMRRPADREAHVSVRSVLRQSALPSVVHGCCRQHEKAGCMCIQRQHLATPCSCSCARPAAAHQQTSGTHCTCGPHTTRQSVPVQRPLKAHLKHALADLLD